VKMRIELKCLRIRVLGGQSDRTRDHYRYRYILISCVGLSAAGDRLHNEISFPDSVQPGFIQHIFLHYVSASAFLYPFPSQMFNNAALLECF
jgi:hypothetical protein